KQKKLIHSTTSDRGEHWQTEEIPFGFDVGSDIRTFDLSPLGLARDGKRLALLLKGRFTKTGSIKFEDVFDQCYTVVSENLGKTWGTPEPVSIRLYERSQAAFEFGI